MNFLFRIFKLLFGITSKPQRRKSKPRSLPSNELIKAKVGNIYDGDTVDMYPDSGGKVCIRLSAIDCPEDGQPWGDKARFGLIKLIGGQIAYLEIHNHEIDPYGRTAATIYVMHNSELINVNEKMVAMGHAWVMRQHYHHLSKSRKISLDQIETWARSKRKGLWNTENPIAPWIWRRRNSPKQIANSN